MSSAGDATQRSHLCENCDDKPVALFCAECEMEFCEQCDIDFHRPVKKASHVRKARFPTDVAEILIKCEKEGKESNYGSSKPEGKDIHKYVLEYSEGYYYLFKNNSSALHLDCELQFTLTNLTIVGFENADRIKVSLPPASLQYVHLRRLDPSLSCHCEITQRFALNAPKDGRLPAVYVPVSYTSDSPREVLEAQTEKEGVCTDHGSQNPDGLLIHQYQWEFSGGYCFLWVNSSRDVHFHKELDLELKNLEIVGAASPDTRKYKVDLLPGQRELMMLREVQPKQAYGISMRAAFSLPKVKAAGAGAATARGSGSSSRSVTGSGDATGTAATPVPVTTPDAPAPAAATAAGAAEAAAEVPA